MKTSDITDYALTFAEAISSPHFNKQSFRVRKKIFATLDEHEKTLVVKLNEVNQSVFSDLGKEYINPVSGGWGKKGWTIMTYEYLNRAIVQDAIRLSYCEVAPDILATLYKVDAD